MEHIAPIFFNDEMSQSSKKIINMDSKVLTDNAIIKPPEIDSKDAPTKKIRYVVDSRDRNRSLYPSPSKYVLNTEQLLKDIVKVELSSADFPFNDYNITKSNNILHTNFGDFEIPEGRYTPEQLAETLTSVTLSQVVASYDSISDKMSLRTTSQESVRIMFLNPAQQRYDDTLMNVYRPRSVGKTLGFKMEDVVLAPNSVQIAPYRVDLVSEKYIVMCMPPAKVIKSKNNTLMDSFAIITDETCHKTDGLDIPISKKSFNPTLPALNTLAFKFYDRDGNLYDFQNKEHRMELVFTCLKQNSCYTNIFKS